jgi:RHS repeat-associated protein
MSALVRRHVTDEFARAANDDCINGGSCNRTKYIYAGGRAVAVHHFNSAGSQAIDYIFSDHQGSVAALTRGYNTQTVVNESFTPYGERRSPTTWSGAPVAGDLTTSAGITRQGYTFQTQLGLWMGMNHMNGRVQDAVTGRFLSADPTIPDPMNPQDYNRYSYADNNPLTFVDPSGFYDKPCSADRVSPKGCAGSIEQSFGSCYGNCGPGWRNSPPGVSWLGIDYGGGNIQWTAYTTSGTPTPNGTPGATAGIGCAALSCILAPNQDAPASPAVQQQDQSPAQGQLIQVSQAQTSCAMCADTVVLYPGTGPQYGQGNANALQVSLPEGPNGLTVTVSNVDDRAIAWYYYALGGNLNVQASMQTTDQNGQTTTISGSIFQSVYPGGSYMAGLPGPYIGPGTVNMQVVNQGIFVTRVTLVVVPLQTNPPVRW